MNYYVYLHRRRDTGEVFYIGKGRLHRAKKKTASGNRSKQWLAVVEESGGFEIEYVAENLTSDQASEMEEYYTRNPDYDWNLVNVKYTSRIKTISWKYFDNIFELSSDSKSGLKHKLTTSNKMTVQGNDVGFLSKQRGYWETNTGGKSYMVHRIVYSLHHKIDLSSTCVIDHIDRNRSNNKINNLRLVNQSVNILNTGLRKDNILGVKNVYQSSDKCYIFSKRINGKQITLRFNTTKYETMALALEAATLVSDMYNEGTT